MRAAQAGRTAGVVALGVIATLMVPLAAVDAAETAVADECSVTHTENFSDGDHHDWTVETAVDGGTAPWGPRQETIARGVAMYADASGPAAKDTRLATPPVLPTADSVVRFHHDRVLGPGDGMVLEVSTDGGRTWEDGGHLLSVGPYDGTTADGRPAWTGPSPAPPLVDDAVPAESAAELGAYAGREIRLSWRLLQTDSDAPTPGGYVSLIDATFERIADRDCADGYTTNPYARCLGTVTPRLTADTAQNEDDTPTWSSADIGLGELWTTGAQGLGAKDDRLVTDPITVTPRTRVRLLHRYLLEPDRDGGTLEYSTDGGGTWQQIPPEWLIAGGYDGARAGGEPAWTASFADHPEFVRPSPEFFLTSVAVLGPLAGEEIRLRARLVQDPMRAGSVPGVHWSVFGGFKVLDTIVDDCSGPPVDEPPPPCDSALVPEEAAVPGVTDSGEELALDVLVLLDVEEGDEIRRLRSDPDTAAQGDALFDEVAAEAADLLDPARTSYDRVDLDLTLEFGLLGPRNQREGTPMQELIDQARDQTNGQVPVGTDVVYVATDRTRSGLDAVAGRADCVGGIESARRAYAAGQLYRDQGDTILWRDFGARVFAHEVGHLLGAHHHYANCAEPAPTYAPVGDLANGACTTMYNDVSLVSQQFSTVSGTVVRGYAEAHLSE